MKLTVNYKNINGEGVIPFKNHESDFCYDLTATSVEEIFPNVYKYGVSLGFQIERSEEDSDEEVLLSLDIRPRSSIYKTGMSLANATGTIDELYTGEVFLIFYHVMKDLPKYEKGDRIGQMKLGFSVPIIFNEVGEFSETARGNEGFGSTGK